MTLICSAFIYLFGLTVCLLLKNKDCTHYKDDPCAQGY